MRHLIFLSLIFLGLQANACLSMPEELILSGSTFSNSIKLLLSKNCGFKLGLSSKDEERAQKNILEDSIKEWNSWLAANPENASEEYRLKRNAFIASLKEKSEQQKKLNHYFKVENRKVCLFADKCETNQTIEVKDNGKVTAIIMITPIGGFIFSVDNSGHKDISKPYLKITADKNQSGIIEAISNGATIGRMEVEAESCAKATYTRSGVLDLSGKDYTPVASGGSCNGAFVARELEKQKGQQPVKAPDPTHIQINK